MIEELGTLDKWLIYINIFIIYFSTVTWFAFSFWIKRETIDQLSKPLGYFSAALGTVLLIHGSVYFYGIATNDVAAIRNVLRFTALFLVGMPSSMALMSILKSDGASRALFAEAKDIRNELTNLQNVVDSDRESNNDVGST